MRFLESRIRGAYLIEPAQHRDVRGVFTRLWCEEAFGRHGLRARFVQINQSLTRRRGTVRGLHYQLAPHAESKLVRCVRGALFDVIVDVRPGSETFGVWQGFELRAEEPREIYVPEGVAHGFQTLRDDSEIVYASTAAHHGASERGIRWNDPAIGIAWPLADDVTLSDKDRAWPDFRSE